MPAKEKKIKTFFKIIYIYTTTMTTTKKERRKRQTE